MHCSYPTISLTTQLFSVGNCTFERYPSTSLKTSYDYEEKILPWKALEAECKTYCRHAAKDGMQCWAVVVRGGCVAYFSSDSKDLTEISHRREQAHTKLHLRLCDEGMAI